MIWFAALVTGLLLLFAFPKQMGALILMLVLGAGGLFALIHNAEQRRAEERREQLASVPVSAIFDATRCSPEFPILLTIRNNNRQTLLALSFDLIGFREGFSSPVYRTLTTHKSDRIIAPNMIYESCWAVPRLEHGANDAHPASLSWRVYVAYPTFGSPP